MRRLAPYAVAIAGVVAPDGVRAAALPRASCGQARHTHHAFAPGVGASMRSATNTTPATSSPRSARSSATIPPMRATSSTSLGLGTGLPLLMPSVEQISRNQSYEDDSRRPAYSRSERVDRRKVDANRETADSGKHQHDQRAANVAMALPVELPSDAPCVAVPLRSGT